MKTILYRIISRIGQSNNLGFSDFNMVIVNRTENDRIKKEKIK